MSFVDIAVVIIIFIFLTTTVDAGNTTSITYVSSVDPDLGFYKVTDNTAHKPAPYKNRVLTINQGDTVIWKNDADKPVSVTIVSEQELFSDISLKLIGDVFSYVFDQPGEYTFYIKEREAVRQTIVVNATDDYPAPTTQIPTEITVIPTETTVIPTTTVITTSIIDSTPNSENITNAYITNTSDTNILDTSGGINISDILNNYVADLLVVITISIIGYIIVCRQFKSEDGIKYGKTDNIDQIAHEWRCERFSTKTIRIYNMDEYNHMYFTTYTKITDNGELIPDDNYFYCKLDAKTNREIIYTHEQNISSIRIEVKNCEPDKPVKYKIEYRGTRVPIIIKQ